MDVVTDARKAMEHWHRGQTSARFETDNRGPGWISSGKGDHGGVSYGSYQFASAVGGVDEYLKSSRYADQFHGLKPATEAFSERWKALAARDEKGFAQEQHDFIQHQYYDVQMDRLKKVGVDLQGRGPAVQDALWSTSVQYRNMTRGVFQNGLKQAYGDDYKLSELSDEQIVRAVQDYKHANVQRHFESSPKQWDSLRERTLNEKSELVALARYDRINHDPQPYQGKTYEQAFGEPAHRQSAARPARAPMADGVLVQGERGNEVLALQQKLAQAGYTGVDGKVLKPDGDFGSDTYHAVRQFQKAHGLEEDGKAGRDTLSALNAGVRPPAQTPAPPSVPSPERHEPKAPSTDGAPVAAAPGGGRITVIEPYGNVTSNRTLAHGISGETAYRELKIHHPNTNAEAVRTGDARKADRQSGMVEGEMENIRTREDKNDIPLVRKDLILTDRLGSRDVMIPNPVAGYAQFNKDATNSISLYSHPAGDPRRELVGQVLHGAAGTSPYKNGDFVEYGAPLIQQSNAGSKPVHAHIEVEPAQFRRYLGDMLNDRITLGGKVHAQGPEAQAARATQQAPMADGMLVKGERGDEIKALQGKLAALGYTAADGKALGTDGIFGKDTLAAVKQFQANNGLEQDGKAGRQTLARLDDPAAVKAGAQTAAAPARAEPTAPAAPSMRDPSHAENPRFNQALEKLQELQQQRVQAGLCPLFANAQETERAAGQLAYESKVAGMRQIDHVVARPDGSGLFAVQGNVGDPAAQRTFVDSRQAVSQSVEASTRQTEELDVQFNQRVQEQQQEQVRNRGL